MAYHDYIEHELTTHEFFGDSVREKLIYYPTVTRESFRNEGRLTDLIESGKLFTDIGLPPLDPALRAAVLVEALPYIQPPLAPATDRAMICGSPAMLTDTAAMLDARGFKAGNHHTGVLGDYVIERAFVEK